MLVSRNQNIEDYIKNKDDNIYKKQCLKQKFSGHKKEGKKKFLCLSLVIILLKKTRMITFIASEQDQISCMKKFELKAEVQWS